MDSSSFEALSNLSLKHVTLICLDQLEQTYPFLTVARANRTLIEYYFTCTPSLPLYILENVPHVDLIAYVDADMSFFASPEPIYIELDHGSIAMVPHDFAPTLRHHHVYGMYNVGVLLFRNDGGGTACLRWWQERCIEWCYDRVEDGKFADQKYLDEWPQRFEGVVVVQHKGVNVAPWNLANRPVRQTSEGLRVGGHLLICYHFHDLRRINRWIFSPQLEQYGATLTRSLIHDVYGPYISALQELEGQSSFGSLAMRSGDGLRWSQTLARTRSQMTLRDRVRRVKLKFGSACRIALRVLERRYLLVVGGRVVGR